MFYKLFDIVTIGIPFGIFKITSGLYYKHDILLWWGIIDISLNFFNFFTYLINKQKILSSCLLAQAGLQFGKSTKYIQELTEDTGESLDVLFSFTIVAIIIGTGAIAKYPEDMLLAWNISVILNVIGAGSVRVFQSLRRYKNKSTH